MAKENHLWGAERIRGELLKLQIRVSKRTILKYMRKNRPSSKPSQNWRTFLHNHANNIWACDFLPVVDVFFGQIYAFFIIYRTRLTPGGSFRRNPVPYARVVGSAAPGGHAL